MKQSAAHRNSVSLALRRAAGRWGERPALRFGERQWTVAELDRAADAVAHWFVKSLGLRRGSRVATYGRNSDAYFLAWLGSVRAGTIHVPVNYALKGDELSYILEQSGSEAVLYDPALEANLAAIGSPIKSKAYLNSTEEGSLLAAVEAGKFRESYPDPDLDEADIVQIMYTSGTTSHPKGAMMSHGAMLAQYASCIEALDYGRGDRGLAALPLYHTAQLQAFSMPQLLAGGWTHLIESPVPELVLQLIEEEKINSFFAPPTVWIGLLRHPDFNRRDLSSLRKLYYGASIMPTSVLEELLARLPEAGFYNVYGQTEIAPVATVLRPEEHRQRPSSAGRPVMNVLTRVVDEEMNYVATGQHGEIVHRSPQLLSGYWKKPADTEEAFTGGWFHSGDVGYYDEEGYLYVVDRVKDVINTGGVLVASREVEEVLFALPAVSEAAVIALPDSKWIEAITAIVVLRRAETADEAAIIAHCRAHLAPYKVPKRVIFVPGLPRNASGKILKRELRGLLP